MERRFNKDRRQNTTPLSHLFYPEGKRRSLRRSEDTKRVTIFDHYKPSYLFYSIAVLCLSLLDAALTLVLLGRGAEELNPVMRYYIAHGPWIFVMVKYGITALVLILMVVSSAIISSRYRLVSSLLLPSCVLLFAAVIIWELYLLAK